MAEVWLLDLGNTQAKLSCSVSFGAHGEVFSFVHPAQGILSPDLFALLLQKPKALILVASTSPQAQEAFDSSSVGKRAITIRQQDIPLEIITTGTGIDRLLVAWAAWKSHKEGVLVADFGTAWTLDAVTREGVFLGGAIGPGLSAQIQSLQRSCPHLPTPSAVEASSEEIPRQSAAAVSAGTYRFLALGVNALAQSFEDSAGQSLGRFLTGGASPLLRSFLPSTWKEEPHLMMKALASLPQRESLDA